MSVTFTIPSSDTNGANTRYGGYITNTLASGGHNYINTIGNDTRIDTKITIASGPATVTMQVYSEGPTQPFDVYVDGVVQTRPTIPGTGSWQNFTILSALATGAHNIGIVLLGGGIHFDTDFGFQVSDSGATNSPPDGYGSQYPIQSSPFTTYGRSGGGFLPTAVDNYPSGTMLTCTLQEPELIFRGTATQLKIWQKGFGTIYRVYQDGSPVGSDITAPSDSKYSYLTVATGLDGTLHEYKIHRVGGTRTVYASHVMLVGGSLATTTPYSQHQDLRLGDSITASQTETPVDTTRGYPYRLSVDLSKGQINGGVGGWSSTDLLGAISAYTGFGTNIDSWSVMIGTNDIGINSTSTFNTNLTSIVHALQAAYPNRPGRLILILPRLDGNNASVPSYNAVITAVGSSTTTTTEPITVSDISTGTAGTLSSSNYVDTVHPNGSGYVIMEGNLLALIAPSAPSTPAGLATSVVATVTITWSASAGATSYKLYKDGSGTALYNGSATTYTDTITLGTSHSYKVTAVNGSGESAQSSAVSASGGSSGGSGGGSRMSIGI